MTRNYQAETAASITSLARRIIMTNLCNEIVGVQPMPNITYIHKLPQPRYQFSRAHWYRSEFSNRYYDEVRAWCTQQFGPQPAVADAWTRWFHNYHDTIFFRDEQDYAWFQLKWS